MRRATATPLDSPRIDRVAYYRGELELPDVLPDGTVVVVGTEDRPKWALFWCPCGRGHVIRVNLSEATRHVWRLAVDERGRPTLRPSVDSYEAGHRCHFLLTHGQIYWARDDLMGEATTAR